VAELEIRRSRGARKPASEGECRSPGCQQACIRGRMRVSRMPTGLHPRADALIRRREASL
jgi:hypothetical protein